MTVAVKHHSYTKNIFIRMALLSLGVVAIVIWQRQFFVDVYFKNQITTAGWIINGGIMLLFLTGLVRLINLFRRYRSEEIDINRFVNNFQRSIDPTEGTDPHSIIAVRYRLFRDLYVRRSTINQNAFAATLLATESSYISYPKFVNNVLILTGVFGTIVSLSIALVGASDMLGTAAEIGELSTVIHGMSTALSTTMTAILCYLFFGYFYLKLIDTQTYLISRVEQVTATTLVPRFQLQPDSVVKDFGEMLQAVSSLVERLEGSHQRFAENVLGEFTAMLQAAANLFERLDGSQRQLSEVTRSLSDLVGEAQGRMIDLDRQFNELGSVLREGFRLPEDGKS